MLIFTIVCIIAAGIAFIVAVMTREIVSEGSNSDANKQIYAASRIEEWAWPSDMHKYAGEKARLKDVGVLLLVVMQRLLADRKSFYPLVVLCVVANSICAVLLFLLGERYWGTEAGLLLFVLYITSFWPYLIILQGGYQGLALMFLFISVCFLQQAEAMAQPFNLIWYAASGVGFGLMLFSSASARKVIPLYLGAFFFSQRASAEPFWFVSFGPEAVWSWAAWANVGAIVLLLSSLGLVLLGYRFLIRALYLGWGPLQHVTLLKNKSRNSLDHYIKIGRNFVTWISYATLSVVGFLWLCFLIFRTDSFYLALLAAFFGALMIAITLLYPDILGNLQGFYTYWTISVWGDHFPLYDDYFKRHYGKIVRLGTDGLRWTVRFFWRLIPFHWIFYIFSVFFLAYLSVQNNLDSSGIVGFVAIFLLSLSPIIWSEITRGPITARPYFPAFAGLLLAIGSAVFEAQHRLSPGSLLFFWSGAIGIVVAGVGWNVWVFLTDVWPSGMGVAWLVKSLDRLGISSFYTYNTRFNEMWVDAIPEDVLARYRIHYITTIDEAQDGYVVVPPTSSKSSNFQSSPVGRSGDFKDDPFLNGLIDSRNITQYAVASFKTFGTSRFWVQIGNVTSYRDLMLGEVTDYDRWRGMAWILDASKLHRDLISDAAGEREREIADPDPRLKLLLNSPS
jgi:hypothetical protein